MPNVKNRHAVVLPLLLIQLHTNDGVFEYDPNSILIAAFQGALPKATFDGEFSVLSGEKAQVYMADDLRIPMTPAEVERFVLRALRPTEYFKLVDRYGMAYDWHDDFYDPKTGEAFQPKM